MGQIGFDIKQKHIFQDVVEIVKFCVRWQTSECHTHSYSFPPDAFYTGKSSDIAPSYWNWWLPVAHPVNLWNVYRWKHTYVTSSNWSYFISFYHFCCIINTSCFYVWQFACLRGAHGSSQTIISLPCPRITALEKSYTIHREDKLCHTLLIKPWPNPIKARDNGAFSAHTRKITVH